MRRIVLAIILLLALGNALAAESPNWSAEVEWGDSIPAGTVYNVKFDSSGRFKAERRGLPITSGGNLTTLLHETTLSASEQTALRTSLERCIRNVDFEEAQGHMVGDGGHVYLYLWDGTIALAVQLHKLRSDAEMGKDVLALIASLKAHLPAGFTK